MSSDTDLGSNEIGTDAALPNAIEEQMAREQISDAKLDKAVREAAEKHFHGEARPKQDSDKSIDETLKATMDKIMARPEPPTMPPLPGSPSIEQTLQAQEQFNSLSAADKRTQSYAFKQVESMRAAAEAFGLEVKTASDIQALRQLMGQDQTQAAPQASAPSEVWNRLGADEVNSDAEGIARVGEFLERHGETFRRIGFLRRKASNS